MPPSDRTLFVRPSLLHFPHKVYKADAADAMWRPPPNTNGTPNESVDDVFVRVRQVGFVAGDNAMSRWVPWSNPSLILDLCVN